MQILRHMRKFSDAKARISKKELRIIQNERLKKALISGQRIVIDFDLPGIMSNKDCRYLAKHTKLLYDLNASSENPFSITFAGLRTDSQMFSTFEHLLPNFHELVVNKVEEPISHIFQKDKTIYLTPDSTEPLGALDKQTVYVLGGLLDYQVKKNKTLTKANILNIETRRLPIPEYMEQKDGRRYSYSKILTINQVFAILLKFQETQDWREALPVGIPARRGYKLRGEESNGILRS